MWRFELSRSRQPKQQNINRFTTGTISTWDKIKNKSLSIHPTYVSQKKLFHMVSITILSSSLLKERWGDSMFRTLNKITWSGHSIFNIQNSPVLTVKIKIPRERNEIKTRLSGHQQQHKRNGNKREKKTLLRSLPAHSNCVCGFKKAYPSFPLCERKLHCTKCTPRRFLLK